jgi:saccharopine dehydrogenase (NAD+, L-lysine-forming)
MSGGSEPSWLLYGAYGYTGRLIAQRAVARGLRPTLAGRDPAPTRALAESLSLEWVACGLEDPGPLRYAVRGCAAVLNAAGPFSATWRPVLAACMAEGCHYLDITGEIDVLEAMQGLREQAVAAGMHVLPGVGFDVVPTDCAAAMVAARVRHPEELSLAFRVTGGPSRGTTLTTIERLALGSAVRRGGQIVPVPLGAIRTIIPFSDGPRRGVAIPWGDVSTAYHSTGIPNVTVYGVLPPGLPLGGRAAGALLKVPVARRWAEWSARRWVFGPSPRELAEGHVQVRAEVRDASGRTAAVEIVGPNPYTLTADAAVAALEAVLNGLLVGPGVHTPSQAFGPDFVLQLPGVRITPAAAPAIGRD